MEDDNSATMNLERRLCDCVVKCQITVLFTSDFDGDLNLCDEIKRFLEIHPDNLPGFIKIVPSWVWKDHPVVKTTYRYVGMINEPERTLQFEKIDQPIMFSVKVSKVCLP
jgi:hypothetical protein